MLLGGSSGFKGVRPVLLTAVAAAGLLLCDWILRIPPHAGCRSVRRKLAYNSSAIRCLLSLDRTLRTATHPSQADPVPNAAVQLDAKNSLVVGLPAGPLELG